jgi:hypothetical protein
MPTARNNEALLTRAPAGRHLCQFHHDGETLSRAVALFTGTGLHRGDGVVIVATPEHTALFLRDLERMEIDATAHQNAGSLVLMDAEETLAQFMHGDVPDWNRFRHTIASVLETLTAQHRRATRAYGEMVSVLWRQGNCPAAIRLEEYWNELSRSHPFTLFCGYLLDGLETGSYEGPLHEIGRTHTDILPTEDDERLRAAIDDASEEVLGMSFSLTLSFSGREQAVGEHRLPIGRRTMLWLQRNMPGSSGMILERARHYYHQERRLNVPPLRLSR